MFSIQSKGKIKPKNDIGQKNSGFKQGEQYDKINAKIHIELIKYIILFVKKNTLIFFFTRIKQN